MNKTLFLLGRERDICEAELRTLLGAYHIQATRQSDALIVEHKTDLPVSFLHNRLGGTQLIAKELPSTGNSTDDIVTYLSKYVHQGIFDFTLLPPHTQKDGLTLKKDLRSVGIRARYIPYHNSATILHNKLTESGGAFLIRNKTVFVVTHLHEFESFSKRDIEKPRRNAKRGMLPPKLARILVNLTGAQTHHVLLDPFCGSGTLLIEAADIGIETLYGTDSSSEAVYDTQQNMEWALSTVIHSHPTYRVHTCDARALSSQFQKASVDCIATEPFMGPPRTGKETPAQIKKDIAQLQDLYKKTLKQFDTILAPGGTAVMTFPCIQTETQTFPTWHSALIENTGLSLSPLLETMPTLLYHRPDQWVARQVVRLIKK